jgi:hypothetical protein
VEAIVNAAVRAFTNWQPRTAPNRGRGRWRVLGRRCVSEDPLARRSSKSTTGSSIAGRNWFPNVLCGLADLLERDGYSSIKGAIGVDA